MCLIIDANIRDLFFDRDDRFSAIWEWIDSGKGRLVFGGKQLTEMAGNYQVRRIIYRLEQAGQAIIRDAKLIDSEAEGIRDACRSNDAHVVALARVSGARTLVSNDDELGNDFKDKKLVDRPRGKVFRGDTLKPYARRDCQGLIGHTKSCESS